MGARDVLTGGAGRGSLCEIRSTRNEQDSAGLLDWTVVPALLPQTQLVAASPAKCEFFFLEELGEDDVTIVNDLYFHWDGTTVENTSDIDLASAKTPQHSPVGWKVGWTHGWRTPAGANAVAG